VTTLYVEFAVCKYASHRDMMKDPSKNETACKPKKSESENEAEG
jgi:hypothetical protein